MDLITAVLTLLAGIGVFLVACTILTTNLESVCSSKLRNLFARASEKKLVGVGVGTVATAAIQSSGATTVLVIGFVNAGIMSLTLAAAVIYGANIGTTVTAQMVAWGGSFDLEVWFGALACVGAFMVAYAKTSRLKSIGWIIAAFGMLFIALDLMKDSMGGLAQEPAVTQFLSSIQGPLAPLLLVIVGLVLTAIVQSSSVVTSIIIAMLAAGLTGFDLNDGIYLALGSNIGSCIVSVLAGFTSGTNAKRTALIHVLFNVFGVTLFVIVGYALLLTTGITYGGVFHDLFGGNDQVALAMFHTIFNVITVIIMLPLTSKLIALVTRMVPDSSEEGSDTPRLRYVDAHMLRAPAIAVGEVKKEIIYMAECAMTNFSRSIRMVTTLDFTDEEEFKRCEKQLNHTNKQLTRFLTKLPRDGLSGRDVIYISNAFHNITDLERIGDYAENIVEYAHRLESSGGSFSQEAIDEINEVHAKVGELYNKVMDAYKASDRELMRQAHQIEQSIDEMTESMASSHIDRLSKGTCTASVGADFLALTSDVERIGDHFYNVAKSVKEFDKVKV